MKRLAGRYREWAVAVLLVGAAALFGSFVHRIYPIDEWLFWRYAAYWVASLACATACFGIGARTLRAIGVRGLPTLELLAIAFGVGLFEFELSMFIAGLLHLYRAALFFVLPIALIALTVPDLRALWARLSQRRRLLGRTARPLGAVGLIALAFGFVGLLAVYFLILSPENVQFDSRWKHLALAEDYVAYGGVRRLDEGWVFDSRPHFTSYLFSWAFLLPKSRLFDRMVLSAHLEFVTFLVTTLIGIPALVRRLVPRADPRAVWAVRFLFPGVLLYDSSLAVGADHFGAMYGVPIALVTLFAWRELSPRWCALLGLLLGAAAMVKETTAMMLAPAPVLALAARLLWLTFVRPTATPGVSRFAVWRGPLTAIAAGLVCSAPLWLTNWISHGDPVYPVLNKYLHVRPWTTESAYRLKWAYEEANMWQPPHTFAGLLTSLKALFTFSFIPNDWGRLHGRTPVFGSLFTLLLPCLVLCRGRLRLWGIVLWVHFAILCWFWVHHQDRYLQGILPLMTAATAALLILAWRSGVFASAALGLLVVLQVVWGGDVYFFQTHSMAKSPLKKSIDLLSSGFEGNYDKRFYIQGQFQAVARELPPHARVLVHDENSHLGLEAQSIMDRFPFEYGISYGLQESPRAVYDLLHGLGATHLLWAAKSKGTDSLAGDLMFYAFLRSAPSLGSFGGFRLAKMPDAPPSGPFNDTVAVFACDGSYPTGLYPVSSLRVPVYGPRQTDFPGAPVQEMPADWPATLAESAHMAATEDRCFKNEGQLTRLGFEKVVSRGRPPATRGQLYSLWFKG